MNDIFYKERCSGCTSCMNACPKNAIKMVSDDNGFKYPLIDKKKCVGCGMCKKVCPVINGIEKEHRIETYMCINKNTEDRINSSSGGIFILLAKQIIRMNGVVFGACIDKDGVVKHESAESINELKKFMGSKYVQSDLKDSYKKAKEYLDNNRYVLFTGTPCQVEGLLTYLRKNYDKLITQDIICHGVPSPRVWQNYLEYRKNIDKQKPIKISFRNKDSGWKNYNIKIYYKNSNSYIESKREDAFYKLFLYDLILRDSCYNCSFKKKYRNSDITLGDFWGIEKVRPEFDDNMGTSVVIINSTNGKCLFEQIKKDIKYKKCNIADIEKYNSAYIKPVSRPKDRDVVLSKINGNNINMIAKKYTSEKLIVRGFKKSKRIVKRALSFLKEK